MYVMVTEYYTVFKLSAVPHCGYEAVWGLWCAQNFLSTVGLCWVSRVLEPSGGVSLILGKGPGSNLCVPMVMCAFTWCAGVASTLRKTDRPLKAVEWEGGVGVGVRRCISTCGPTCQEAAVCGLFVQLHARCCLFDRVRPPASCVLMRTMHIEAALKGSNTILNISSRRGPEYQPLGLSQPARMGCIQRLERLGHALCGRAEQFGVGWAEGVGVRIPCQLEPWCFQSTSCGLCLLLATLLQYRRAYCHAFLHCIVLCVLSCLWIVLP